MHTVRVYRCVVGGEYELGVYADGRSYSCVCFYVGGEKYYFGVLGELYIIL